MYTPLQQTIKYLPPSQPKIMPDSPHNRVSTKTHIQKKKIKMTCAAPLNPSFYFSFASKSKLKQASKQALP